MNAATRRYLTHRAHVRAMAKQERRVDFARRRWSQVRIRGGDGVLQEDMYRTEVIRYEEMEAERLEMERKLR